MILYTANEYQIFLRQQLEHLSPNIVAEIQTIISKQANKATRLDVEIYSDKLNGRLPLSATLYNNENKIKTWKLADEISCVLPAEKMEVLRQFDRAGVEISEVTFQTLILWFADCWDQAGGRESSLQTQISIHDDIEAFDLNRRKWIEKEMVSQTSKP